MNLSSLSHLPIAKRTELGGFQYDEAKDFINFCVDLDSQDDRQGDPTNPRYQAKYRAKWQVLFDSRVAVAQDLVNRQNDLNDPWHKLYDETASRYQADLGLNKPHMPAWKSEELAKDPRYNGFGPYQSAWVLYQDTDPSLATPAYVVAIRGTVFSAEPSALENFLFHPVLVKRFLNDDVTFASDERASAHSGFSHATFSLLMDDRYGILRQLSDKVPSGSRVYIVGHSQGAAMATLVQGFLHYETEGGGSPAGTGSDAEADRFQLKHKRYILKSFIFAQPKPGNFYFSADFARYTQNDDSAIVINNDLDIVPQVPLTLQSLNDVDGYYKASGFAANVLHWVSGIGGGFRGLVGRAAEPVVKRADSGYGYFFGYDKKIKFDADRIGSSWDFVSAGRVILLFGRQPERCPNDDLAKDDFTTDDFIQHHAWVYRELMEEQFGSGVRDRSLCY